MYAQRLNKLFFLLESSFGDVATVQELSDILILNEARLMDLTAGEGDVVQIVSFNDEFIFHFFSSGDLNTGKHVDLSDDLFTQEVLDFEGCIVVGDEGVDGEMGIGESHLESVTFSDTVDHVSDLRSDGGNAGLLLSLGHPELELQLSNTLFVFSLGNGERNVLERSSDGSSGTLNGDFSGLEINIDSSGDDEFFFGKNVFHVLASLIN